jgi:CRISPR-associated protein Cas1
MRTQNLHELPRVRDRLSFLYAEHCRVDKEDKAIAIHNADGMTPVPCANLALLLLGPGTKITHAAALTLADNGCLVCWCGEHGVRFYAAGMGVTRDAARLLHQAALTSRRSTRLKVVRRMYEARFREPLPAEWTLQQIRGREGVRVRDAYARASMETGVPWQGRNYNHNNWRDSDPVNRALSTGNACLYGLCHAAIVAAGYSPALGFIHTGKQLSFVYDIADLYKVDLTIPAAFTAVAEGTDNLERRVRHTCRDIFARERLLEKIVKDMDTILQVPPDPDDLPEDINFDTEAALPGGLWDTEEGVVPGGQNYADTQPEPDPPNPVHPPPTSLQPVDEDDEPWLF